MVRYPQTEFVEQSLAASCRCFTADHTIRKKSLLIPCFGKINVGCAAVSFSCRHGKLINMQSKYCDEMKHNVFHYIRNGNEEKEV